MDDEKIKQIIKEYPLAFPSFYIEAGAKAARRELIEWLNEYCTEHNSVDFPEEMGGGSVKRNRMKRHRCQHCWQSLLKELSDKADEKDN